MSKAAFLDRDGVINVDHGYVSTWKDFEFLPGAERALQSLHGAGYQLVIVSNQSGIGRGFYTEQNLIALNRALSAHLEHEFETRISGFYHCPHHPTEALGAFRKTCDCRKPAPGMILRAAEELGLDLPQSLLVGDKTSDILAGQAAGVGRMFRVASPSAAPENSPAVVTVAGLREVPAKLVASDK